LDDGVYVFQVTDPSGKTLLSSDTAANRRFTVTDGVISTVAPGTHVFGHDVDHDATTVQLMPYKDTPNNGGVYKVWVVREEDFALGVAEFGLTLQQGLAKVDVGLKGNNKHGFIPSHCKTTARPTTSRCARTCRSRSTPASTTASPARSSTASP
jgi:hypothetical protein